MEVVLVLSRDVAKYRETASCTPDATLIFTEREPLLDELVDAELDKEEGLDEEDDAEVALRSLRSRLTTLGALRGGEGCAAATCLGRNFAVRHMKLQRRHVCEHSWRWQFCPCCVSVMPAIVTVAATQPHCWKRRECVSALCVRMCLDKLDACL